jgi:hypothetical protein
LSPISFQSVDDENITLLTESSFGTTLIAFGSWRPSGTLLHG